MPRRRSRRQHEQRPGAERRSVKTLNVYAELTANWQPAGRATDTYLGLDCDRPGMALHHLGVAGVIGRHPKGVTAAVWEAPGLHNVTAADIHPKAAFPEGFVLIHDDETRPKRQSPKARPNIEVQPKSEDAPRAGPRIRQRNRNFWAEDVPPLVPVAYGVDAHRQLAKTATRRNRWKWVRHSARRRRSQRRLRCYGYPGVHGRTSWCGVNGEVQ